jgi:hypothetical protein
MELAPVSLLATVRTDKPRLLIFHERETEIKTVLRWFGVVACEQASSMNLAPRHCGAS